MGELLRSVECPVCRCVPTPPIYNCRNGHSSCNSCIVRLPSKKCGYCLAQFTKMRNYPLENLITTRMFKCDFQNVGCPIMNLSMSEYDDHVRMCLFQPRYLYIVMKHDVFMDCNK